MKNRLSRDCESNHRAGERFLQMGVRILGSD